jgi:two-component system, response regulator FlrC
MNRTVVSIQDNATDPVAEAEATRQMLTLARRVAASECTVLVSGESGTGKEVLARFIHRHSPRATGPFIAVNCAAIPDHMLEATLFGWERGAFTGAHNAHSGKFEQAQGGTLLLDEITEMPLALQAKLLRVLQEREVERLGSERSIRLDVRVLATTNRNIREEVQLGRFREDLYYRINVFPLQLLPLRARSEDVLPLAMRMLAGHCRRGGHIPALSADAAQCLLAHDWPGNVRELDNVMQRALVLCDGGLIDARHISFEVPPALARAVVPPAVAVAPEALPAPVTSPVEATPTRSAISGGDLARTLLATEQQVLLEALRSRVESRERIAQRLGISPRTLRYKLARLRAAGIDLGAAVGSAA